MGERNYHIREDLMRWIKDNPNCTALEVAEAFDRDHKQVRRILGELAKKGWLSVEKETFLFSDRALHRFKITSAAKKILKK